MSEPDYDPLYVAFCEAERDAARSTGNGPFPFASVELPRKLKPALCAARMSKYLWMYQMFPDTDGGMTETVCGYRVHWTEDSSAFVTLFGSRVSFTLAVPLKPPAPVGPGPDQAAAETDRAGG